ncbi:MAG: hypothetical protein AAFV45_13600 [Pseudomonadota bacterium]
MSASADRDIQVSLLIMRWSIAAFLLVWGFDKILASDRAVSTFSKFYMQMSDTTIIAVLGIAQIVLILAFALGAFKTLTYGAITVMHAVSTFASWERYLAPFDRPNILFFAAILVLGALIALFIMRRRDTLLIIGQ